MMLAALVLAVATAVPSIRTAAAPVATPAAEADVRAAIVRAVQARMAGPLLTVEVTVEDLQVHGTPAGTGLRATPDAGSRAGGPMRFILHTAPSGRGGARSGSADAVVRLRARFARATRALGPGTIVAPGDVASASGDPGRVPLQPLPQADAIVGARVRRTVAADGVIAADTIAVAPLVRSGDDVATVVRVGPVEAQGRATALEDGAFGAIVRVQVEKRRLRGRVSGAGEVEIIP
ncbi:MAG: flagellar basal body P-ring formation chaperone FlgA [Vicinamibacteraceae bacterium]